MTRVSFFFFLEILFSNVWMDTGKDEEEDEDMVPMDTSPDDVEAKSMFSVCLVEKHLIFVLFCSDYQRFYGGGTVRYSEEGRN